MFHDDGVWVRKKHGSLVHRAPPGTPPSSQKRVLIADDSALVRDILTKRAVQLGLSVLPCDSVAATRAVDADAVAAALLDLDLGDGQGTDVASTLRASRPELPIAFFSSATAEQKAAAAQFGPVFQKPDQLDAAMAWLAAETR
jgi:two-component system, response regulator RegA